MSDFAIEASQLVKKFPARAGTGDKPAEGAAPAPKRKPWWQRGKKEPQAMFTAVNGVDLQIKRGEIFGLLGPNGAGKSTTIRMLCTLLEPTSGTARVNGFDTVKNANDVRRSLGTVLAGERSIYWKLSGRENLEYFAALYHIPAAIAKKRVDELIERMEIKDRANELVEKYSTGMRQRIAIAKALLARPPILLLDEPTLGLDPQAARNLRELIATLKEEGHTILLTTHYMEEADQLSDRIGIIDTGKVIALDTPENLKQRINQKEIIRLELTGWHDDLGDKLKGITGVETLTTHQQGEADLWEVNMHSNNSRATLPRIVEAISGNGTRLVNMNIVKPSLEDVFIQLTGKALRD
ncbi:ATP-binding cassette domain-containing protein [Candidatus Villigracilis affinis]|uniref:ATP-binding cassette domain-containing protein n=1 Tax=Candidatus Villigracilis affinis TaxID=3140682 RepID=UPI001DC65222|nr:ATP-binding cassette domain-containing protein [Anaerolineales bacterium]